MTRAIIALLSIGLAGCVVPDKLDGTPDGVWVQVPAVNLQSPDSVAEGHCAKHGKTAVLQSKMTGNRGDWRQQVKRGNHTPILYYDCK